MSEPAENIDLLLDKALKVLRASPDGFLKEDLSTQLNMSPQVTAEIIKKLLEFRCLKIFKSSTGSKGSTRSMGAIAEPQSLRPLQSPAARLILPCLT